MQNQLIPVVSRHVGSETIPTVNARELHAFLEVGKHFGTWITDRINQFEFVENQDFIVFPEIGENPKGGRPSKEYALSLDMAKELSMVERNTKGKQARQYFIECERVAKSTPALPTDPMAILKLVFESQVQTNERVAAVETKIQEFNENIRLHQWQCYELKLAVTNKVNEFHKQTGVERKALYSGMWNRLKLQMHVASYQAIPAVKFDEALSFASGLSIHDMPDYVKAQALDLQGGAA